MKKESLTKFALVSIIAALITIALKSTAYLLTGSVGLFSDALESGINLVAAVVALLALYIAQKPPDETHVYGHSKIEYFSSIIEGFLILLASLSIGYAAIERIIFPHPVEQVGIGLFISSLASLVNLIVGLWLLYIGKKHDSITLEADGQHLLTDVWTSVGVIVGVGLVVITKQQIFDSVVALVVAGNILFTGFGLVHKSISGLLDSALPDKELKEVKAIINTYCKDQITYHGLMTRQSAMRRFVSFHLLVPGSWSIQQGHDLMEKVERELRQQIRHVSVIIHIEPLEDPTANEDIGLDRNID